MAPLTAVCTRRVSKSWNRLLWIGCVGGGRSNQTTLGKAFKFGSAVSRLPSQFVFHGSAVTRCSSEDSSRPSRVPCLRDEPTRRTRGGTSVQAKRS